MSKEKYDHIHIVDGRSKKKAFPSLLLIAAAIGVMALVLYLSFI